MTYTMLGMYSFTKTSDTKFDIYYEIPENCSKIFNEEKGEYIITIELDPGQTDPSTTFIGYTDVATVLNDALIVNFDQCERTGTIRKPKLTILEP